MYVAIWSFDYVIKWKDCPCIRMVALKAVTENLQMAGKWSVTEYLQMAGKWSVTEYLQMAGKWSVTEYLQMAGKWSLWVGRVWQPCIVWI
jgi:hypothetical protein